MSSDRIEEDIALPVGGPGKDDEQDSYLEADQNVDNDGESGWHVLAMSFLRIS